MSSSEVRDSDSGKATDRGARPRNEAKDAPSETVGAEEERSARRFTSSRVMGAADRERLLKKARDIDFPIGLRGYDRGAVDRYVERVTRLITELEMSSSPEAAVRHALDEVSEETRDILQRAHQTADEITARSRSKADDRLQEAEREAQQILEAAQQEAQAARASARRDAQELTETTARDAQELSETTAREAHELREISQREAEELRDTTMRELAGLREAAARETQQLRAAAQREADDTRDSARREADEMLERAETRARDLGRNAEAIWRERRRLIDDMRAVGEQLIAIGEVEGKRFPRPAEELVLSGEESAEQHDGRSTPTS